MDMRKLATPLARRVDYDKKAEELLSHLYGIKKADWVAADLFDSAERRSCDDRGENDSKE